MSAAYEEYVVRGLVTRLAGLTALAALAACSQPAPVAAPPIAPAAHAPIDAALAIAHVDAAPAKPVPADDTSLTSAMVLAEINASHMATIRACYKALLAIDRTAHGTISITFDIDATGAARNSVALGFTDALDTCITDDMASWQFPIPRDTAGQPTIATFTTRLKLVP